MRWIQWERFNPLKGRERERRDSFWCRPLSRECYSPSIVKKWLEKGSNLCSVDKLNKKVTRDNEWPFLSREGTGREESSSYELPSSNFAVFPKTNRLCKGDYSKEEEGCKLRLTSLEETKPFPDRGFAKFEDEVIVWTNSDATTSPKSKMDRISQNRK